MLRDGAPPPTFRRPPPPAVPMPINHFLVRPRRRAAERTNAAIDALVRELAGVSQLGIVKKNRNKSKKHHLLLHIYLGPEIPAVP